MRDDFLYTHGIMKLFNTLSHKIEDFVPLNPPKVGMYTCGPTVYDYQHIGNLRTYIFEDILERSLIANGFKVLKVMNITDIEDKIIKKALAEGVDIQVVTEPLIQEFFDDSNKLNILPANIYPKATEHISKMVKYIEKLIDKGLAYVNESSVYFDISEFPEYG